MLVHALILPASQIRIMSAHSNSSRHDSAQRIIRLTISHAIYMNSCKLINFLLSPEFLELIEGL